MPIDMYAEEIISNYEHPHNKGKIDDASISMHNHNPVCGDDIIVYLKITDGKISDIKFEGSGCAISMATASMLTDDVKGKTLSDIEQLGVKSVFDILGFDPGPARLKCATLSLRAVKEATFAFEHKSIDAQTQEL